MEIPACVSPFFDSTHSLPQVRDLQSVECYFTLLFILSSVSCLTLCSSNSFVGPPIFGFSPSSSRGGPINAEPAPADFEVPEASDNQDEDEVEGSLGRSDSTLSLPLAESETQVAEKKRKRAKELTSDTSQTIYNF
jgi:hypothetical protein